jgi:Tfp pilus assembly protein PilX
MAMQPRIIFGRQQGVVMVIALVMLLAVTLMVVTAANLVQANLKVVQNAESRELARSAALAAIEEATSSLRFTTSPGAIFSMGCLLPNQKCYDYNGDGRNDVKVLVQNPTCVAVTPTKNSDLDVFGSPAQASCYLPGYGVVYSMCAYSVWEFRATATDVVTGTEVSLRQGVSVLTSLNKIESACPVT